MAIKKHVVVACDEDRIQHVLTLARWCSALAAKLLQVRVEMTQGDDPCLGLERALSLCLVSVRGS